MKGKWTQLRVGEGDWADFLAPESARDIIGALRGFSREICYGVEEYGEYYFFTTFYAPAFKICVMKTTRFGKSIEYLPRNEFFEFFEKMQAED